MEVISLISASIVARHIINVHLWRERERERGVGKKKLWPLPHSVCSAVIFSQLGCYALLCPSHFVSTRLRRLLAALRPSEATCMWTKTVKHTNAVL